MNLGLHGTLELENEDVIKGEKDNFYLIEKEVYHQMREDLVCLSAKVDAGEYAFKAVEFLLKNAANEQLEHYMTILEKFKQDKVQWSPKVSTG